MTVNLNYVAWENSLSLPEVKKSVMCEDLFHLKSLNVLVLKYFLDYLGSSVKTIIVSFHPSV